MRFQLVRFITVASLGMFALVAAALIYFERDQGAFFKEVQATQIAFFKTVQEGFAKQQDEASRRDLLAIHEAGNVNLTRLFANALWERDFAPFVAKTQNISVEHCRAMPDEKEKSGLVVPTRAKKDCFGEVGRAIAGLPGFKELDAKVFDAMKRSTVFKIKVFDLRGITVYSSEHKQLGEDKMANAGWRSAVDGKPASELTHRDKFSAFEGVVENRDMIGSYQPVYRPGTDSIVAVFEVYSDVTPFLDRIKKTSAQIGQVAATNQQKIAVEATEAQSRVEATSMRVLVIVIVLLVILFGALYSIVRRADGIMVRQEKERESSQQQLAQSEKMALLGQMVAGVAHQLNTPLAFSRSNVEMVQQAIRNMQAPMMLARMMTGMVKKAEGEQLTLNVTKVKANVDKLEAGDADLAMLDQMLQDVLDGVGQMNELVVNLRDFTRLDRAKTAEADLNKSLHTVVYIAKSVIPHRIVILEAFGKLPPVECNPSQLNQVFLNLINNAAQAIDGPGTITVRSKLDGEHVSIEVEDNGQGIPPDVLPNIFDLYFTTKPEGEGTGLGLAIARDIVRSHGGEITVDSVVGDGTTFTVRLPIKQVS